MPRWRCWFCFRHQDSFCFLRICMFVLKYRFQHCMCRSSREDCVNFFQWFICLSKKNTEDTAVLNLTFCQKRLRYLSKSENFRRQKTVVRANLTQNKTQPLITLMKRTWMRYQLFYLNLNFEHFFFTQFKIISFIEDLALSLRHMKSKAVTISS